MVVSTGNNSNFEYGHFDLDLYFPYEIFHKYGLVDHDFDNPIC